MDTTKSSAPPCAPTTEPYRLYRVFPDGTEVSVPGSETADSIEGIEHGYRMMHEQPESAFSLYRGEGRVAKFNHKALAPRLGLGRVGALLPVLS